MAALVGPFAPADAAPGRGWQRAGGGALVILLHLLLLLAALHAITQPPGRPRPQREMTLLLPRLPRSAPRTEALPPAAPSPRAITIPPPVVSAPPLPAAPPATADLKALGESLFGCAPENLGSLPAEERARCGNGIVPSDGTTVAEPRSHVKNPGLRAAEMEKKNTPMSVPCVSIQTRALGNFQDHVLMVDPICAAKELNK